MKSIPLPPGPRGRQFYNLHKRMNDFSGLVAGLHREYGDIVSYEIPKMKCAAVFEPGLIQEVLVEKEPLFPPYFPTGAFDVIKTPFLAVSRDADHRRLRKLIMTVFGAERLAYYGEVIIANALALRERCADKQQVDIHREFEQLVWGALQDAIIGRDMQADPDMGKRVLDGMKVDILMNLLPMNKLLRRLPLPHAIRAARANKVFDDVVYRAIERSRDPAHSGGDVVTHLVRAAREGIVDWSYNDDREIRDEALGLLCGAVDAPIAALSQGLWYLDRYPAVRERLEQEVDDVLGDRTITPEDCCRLPYALAVFREVVRLEPPAYIMLARETQEDCTVGGYLVRKGTLMHVCLRVLHRRADYWDNPDDFIPERWIDDPARGGQKGDGGAYLPFGAEPRYCRGSNFAEMLCVLTWAVLVQRLRLAPVSARAPDLINLGVGVKGPIPATVGARK